MPGTSHPLRLTTSASRAPAGGEPPFGLRVEHHPVLTTIAVSGELDIATAGELDTAITRALAMSPDEILLDLSELSFADSSGVRALVRAAEQCEPLGCRLVLLRGPRQVQRLLAITGVLDRFRFAD